MVPNWFYYWSQIRVGGALGYLDELWTDYINEEPITTAGLYAATSCWGDYEGPNNLIYAFPQSALLQNQSDLGMFEPYTGVQAFHITMYHEYNHLLHQLRWTFSGRGRVIQSGDNVNPFEDWAPVSSPDDPLFNRYRDMNGNGQFDFMLALDLDQDGEIEAEVVESEIMVGLGGVLLPEPGVDVNHDGDLDDVFSEMDAENLDSDFDRVPDWDDLDPERARIAGETMCEQAELDFIDSGLADEVVLRDWAAEGMQHGSN